MAMAAAAAIEATMTPADRATWLIGGMFGGFEMQSPGKVCEVRSGRCNALAPSGMGRWVNECGGTAQLEVVWIVGVAVGRIPV